MRSSNLLNALQMWAVVFVIDNYLFTYSLNTPDSFCVPSANFWGLKTENGPYAIFHHEA